MRQRFSTRARRGYDDIEVLMHDGSCPEGGDGPCDDRE